jgi:hypothetical protein
LLQNIYKIFEKMIETVEWELVIVGNEDFSSIMKVEQFMVNKEGVLHA